MTNHCITTSLYDGKAVLKPGKLDSFLHSPRLIAMAPVGGKLIPTDNTAVYIVTGGNRGLGIEHVKQFLEKTDAKIVATARQPREADELNTLSKKYAARLAVIKLDTSSESSIEVYHIYANAIAKSQCFSVAFLLNESCDWI